MRSSHWAVAILSLLTGSSPLVCVRAVRQCVPDLARSRLQSVGAARLPRETLGRVQAHLPSPRDGCLTLRGGGSAPGVTAVALLAGVLISNKNVPTTASEYVGGILTNFCKMAWLGVVSGGMALYLPIKMLRDRLCGTKAKVFRSILITGASSGIGAEFALQYACPGTTLTLTARRKEKLDEVQKACEAKGARVTVVACDVTDANAMRAAIIAADTQKPLDLVIANAGVHGQMLTPQNNIICEDSSVSDVNVMGVVNTLNPAIERMLQRGTGQVAIMSSMASFFPCGDPFWCSYAASKVWARAYGMGLRGALSPSGIGVTVLCPGFVASEMADAIKESGTFTPFCRSTAEACNIMREALARNAGVCTTQKYSFVSMPVTYMMASNILPDFIWHALFGAFRLS